MNDTQLVLDIWEAVRDSVPVAKRAEVANGILRAFADYGFEAREICDIVDEDDDLEQAFEEVFEGEMDDEDEEDEL